MAIYLYTASFRKSGKVQLGPRYEGQLNPMAEPIPHEVRPLVRTHVYHPYHAADRQAETDSRDLTDADAFSHRFWLQFGAEGVL